MPGPKIFVSYSARKVPNGGQPDRELAEALVVELKKPSAPGENDQFDPWWDEQDLEAGDLWNESISRALASCHGAVVLLSDISKESQFVRHEAGYLSVRKFDEDASFPLLVYRLRGLQPEQVGPFFQAIDFSRIQSKEWKNPDENMFREIKTRLAPAHLTAKWPDGPKAVLEEQLAAEFAKETISVASLRYAAREVGWIEPDEVDRWGHPKAVPRIFVRRLIASPIEEQYGALEELGAALDDDERERIFELVAPFWIEERAASQFDEIHKAEPGKRVLITNGELANFTPMMFARRRAAHKKWKDRRLLPEERGEDEVEVAELPLGESHRPFGRAGNELKAQALKSILHQLGLEPGATPAEIHEQFRKHTRKRKWVYSILTDIANDDLDDLAELVNEWGEAVFIVLTGSHPIEIPAKHADLLRPLDPPFRSDAEQSGENPTRHHEKQASEDYHDFREALHEDL